MEKQKDGIFFTICSESSYLNQLSVDFPSENINYLVRDQHFLESGSVFLKGSTFFGVC